MALLDKLEHAGGSVPAIADAEEIYAQLSAEPTSPVRRMVEPDYLEKLRVKFLDTRQSLQSEASQEREDALVSQDQPSTSLTGQDYEQLVYVNVSPWMESFSGYSLSCRHWQNDPRRLKEHYS